MKSLGNIRKRETYISRLKAFEVRRVLFFYKDDEAKGFKLLNNIRKQAKFYLVCLIEIKLFGHPHLVKRDGDFLSKYNA